MDRLVMKFGGTSVEDPAAIGRTAAIVAGRVAMGKQPVVVVSAMGKATDNLIGLADSVSKTQSGREMDMLLTTGERVSAALTSWASVAVPKSAAWWRGTTHSSNGERDA